MPRRVWMMSALLLAGCANSPSREEVKLEKEKVQPAPAAMTLQQTKDLYKQTGGTSADRKAKPSNEAIKARSQAIFDTALGVGVKSGITWQLRNINAAIKKREREFDTIYDFGYLMVAERVVPPVITEARDLYNQDGNALRLSGAYYKIESQARFSSVPPSWREYLNFPKSEINRELLAALAPRDVQEKKLWDSAVADGWKQGIEAANQMLRYALDRMNRDFTGMIRFQTFVVEGKITMPAVASESIAVTKTGESMAVDETLLRISTLPEFNAKVTEWNSFIKSSPSAPPPPEPPAEPMVPLVKAK